VLTVSNDNGIVNLGNLQTNTRSMKNIVLVANHNFRKEVPRHIDDAQDSLATTFGKGYRFLCFTFLEVNGLMSVLTPIKNQRFAWKDGSSITLKRKLRSPHSVVFVEEGTLGLDEFCSDEFAGRVKKFPRRANPSEIARLVRRSLV